MRAIAAAAAVVAASAAVQLNVNTSTVKSLDYVLATATGLPAKASVWMGIFYPANASVAARAVLPYPATAPWTENAPAEYVQLTSDANGNANFTWRVVNALTDAQVWVFSGSATAANPQALAGSGPITFTDVDSPVHGHLARMSDPTMIRVIWNSRHNDDNPTVRWGTTAGGPYPNVAYAESYTYNAEDLCGEPATTHGWFWSGYWHYAVINGLQPGSGQVVYYSYGSDAHGWSDEMSFMTPVAPGSPVKVLLCADMGVSTFDQPATDHWAEPDATETIGHMRDWVQGGSGYDWSLVLHVGDISYATGYQLKWALYMTAMQGLYDRAFYTLGLGNHERDWPGTSTHYDTSMDSGGECGIATQTRFPSPANGAAPYKDEEWYSLVVGDTTVVMLGTEMEVGPGSSQYIWLNQTLAAVNRSVTPWLILAGHRPMYYVEDSAAGGTIDPNFQSFEHLLQTYQVDLALWGHVHNAYASCHVYDGKCVTTPLPGVTNGYLAPVHVSIGNAGQGLTAINPTTQPGWVDFQGAYWGYSTWESFNATDAVVNMYRNSDDGSGKQTMVYSIPLHREPVA